MPSRPLNDKFFVCYSLCRGGPMAEERFREVVGLWPPAPIAQCSLSQRALVFYPRCAEGRCDREVTQAD